MVDMIEERIVASIFKTQSSYQLRINMGNSVLSVMNDEQFDQFIACMQKMKEGEIVEYIFPITSSSVTK